MKTPIDRMEKLFQQQDYERTEKYCHAWLRDNSQDQFNIKYLLSLTKLHNRDLYGGLKLYKARWLAPDMISLKQQLLKYAPYVDSWDEVRDRAMIITGEQGYGDEMMFSHVLAHLRPMCRKLLVIASKPVQPLLQYNHPNIEFIGMGEPLDHRKGEFDGIATMADMFRAYVLQHRMAPPLSRYQAAHSAQYETAEKPKIAFVYRAGYDNVIRQPGDNATQRSISPMILQSLAADYDLYSFQVPVVETLGFVKQSLGSSFNTFLDTANALATMDMAISCDTAFAHLALAMGKPTIMVYDHYLDWRWKNNLYPAVNVTTTRQFDAAYVATIR